MKIKVLWGFIGNALLLGAESPKAAAGQIFDEVNDEYGHTLVGKGLAEELDDEAEPKPKGKGGGKTSKPAAPKETKPATPATAPVTTPTEPVTTTATADPGAAQAALLTTTAASTGTE